MEFKDRVANKPNRVKLTHEDTEVVEFVTVELADEPIEPGTPLNAENMNKLLNKEDTADFVVEQGTSGVWKYRKWNSGIVELWTSSGSIQTPITTAWGVLYLGDNAFPQIDYPFKIDYDNFAPIVNFDLGYNGNYSTAVGYCFDPTRDTENFYAKTPSIRVWSATKQTGSREYTSRITVIGRWK